MNIKEYSLVVAPKKVVAVELGKARKRDENSDELFDKIALKLGTSKEVLLEFEKGNFTNIDRVNSYLNAYYELLDFGLLKMHDKESYSVLIPSVRKKKTYWMAIDEYTTRFDGKDSLLDDIRENNYLDISGYDNSELWVSIEYPRENNTGSIDIVYSDYDELRKFIDKNDFASSFSFGNPYVERLTAEIIELQRSPSMKSTVEPSLRVFMRNGMYKYYSEKLVRLAKRCAEEGIKDSAVADSNRYGNIRGYCIIHSMYDKEKDKIDERLESSYYEPKHVSDLDVRKVVESPKLERHKSPEQQNSQLRLNLEGNHR